MTMKETNTNERKVQKKLNLKNDIIFKAFFSRKGNEKFLIDFLNALLDIEITKINIKEEVNIEKLSKYEKGGRLDLQAQLNDGIIVNIEMQLKNEYNIKERTVVYGAKTISRQTYRQMKYKEVKKVILVNILDYNMLGFDEYITKSKTVVENHREYELIDGIKWIFIELPKFRKSNPDMNNKLNQ